MKRPKRPLSAFNLFFRFKRAKILEVHQSDEQECIPQSKAVFHNLINTASGLEGYYGVLNATSPKQMKELRRAKIRSALHDHMYANEYSRKRSHRKSHGCMSFLEMNKIMSDSWNIADDFTKSIFQELADEGRVIYYERLAKYYKNHPSPKQGCSKPATASVASKGRQSRFPIDPHNKSHDIIEQVSSEIVEAEGLIASHVTKHQLKEIRAESDDFQCSVSDTRRYVSPVTAAPITPTWTANHSFGEMYVEHSSVYHGSFSTEKSGFRQCVRQISDDEANNDTTPKHDDHKKCIAQQNTPSPTLRASQIRHDSHNLPKENMFQATSVSPVSVPSNFIELNFPANLKNYSELTDIDPVPLAAIQKPGIATDTFTNKGAFVAETKSREKLLFSSITLKDLEGTHTEYHKSITEVTHSHPDAKDFMDLLATLDE